MGVDGLRMATREPPTFFKETRLNLEPSSPSFVVDVKLSSPKPRRQSIGSSKPSPDRIACEAGIYHRKYHAYPRSLHWSIRQDHHVLSLDIVDVWKPEKAADTPLVLNFHFTHAIQRSCVAISDSPEHDAFDVFVLDEAGQLYTLLLRPDSFRKRSFVEAGLGDAVKVVTLGALSSNIKHPHDLITVNSNRLMLSLRDGGHLRLDRNRSIGGAQPPWKETFYNAKGWSSFSGLINIIGIWSDYDSSTAAAAVETDFGLNNASFLFTVCLDHRLRIWNIKSGQMLQAVDLLNVEQRDPDESEKWRLDPTQRNLIRIVGQTEGKRLCVTYSPIGSGEFKFWRLESDDENTVDIRDAHPDSNVQFIPTPPPGSDVWTLADFCVTEREGHHGFQMWVLWKNNMAYRVHELSFLLTELPDVWRHGWRSVHHATSTASAPVSGPSDSVDATERWLKCIMRPGRFPRSTIEAALSSYERAIGAEVGKSPRQNLVESLCHAISLTSSLRKNKSGALDHEEFRNRSESHWRNFYRILVELDKPRGEALSLSYEPRSEMPWVVCADTISAIREASILERIWHSPQSYLTPGRNLGSLIATGQNFIAGFSDGMMQICQSVLRAELFQQTTQTDQERIQFFSDKAGFWRQISDEDCAQVTEILGTNFKHATSDVYDHMLAACNETWTRRHAAGHPLTEMGRKIVLKAAEDIADLQWDVCFSQLILLVHMEFEFDRPEEALHTRLDIGAVYRSLLQRLSRLDLIRWSASVLLPTPFSKAERSASISGSTPVSNKRANEEYKLNTVLEESVGHLLDIPDAGPDHAFSIPSAITRIATSLCAPESNIELHPHYIQCALLVRNRPDLASELGPFSSPDPFSVYIQGRVALALRDYSTAAHHFKKAAYGMSLPQAHPGKHSSRLLDDHEWNMLFNGMPCYYAHIVGLYERHKAFSFVIDFARLSLQFINSTMKEADVIRQEMQGRLFTAATLTSHFQLAHSTVVAMKDRAMQHSCIRSLVLQMCDTLHNTDLVELSFPGLQNVVDEILAQKCRQTLDVVVGIPYHRTLYSWRIKRNDYRGAAAVLFDRILKLKEMGQGDQFNGEDGLDTAITRQYLELINVLSCVDQNQAWIIAEEYSPRPAAKGAPVPNKRKVLTLADIRKEYQDELDRIAAIQNNQFGFMADDEMEIL